MAAPLLLAAVIVEFSAVVSAIIEHPSMDDVMDVVSPYERKVEERAKLAKETLRQGALGFAMCKTCPRVQIATYPTNPESGSETRSVSRIEARQQPSN